MEGGGGGGGVGGGGGGGGGGGMNSFGENHILLFTIFNPLYPITVVSYIVLLECSKSLVIVGRKRGLDRYSWEFVSN